MDDGADHDGRVEQHPADACKERRHFTDVIT